MIQDIFSSHISQGTMYYLAMLIPLLLQIFGMLFGVLVDNYIGKIHKRVFLIIAILALSLIVQNYVENLLAAGEPRVLLRTLVAIYGYSVRPVIIVLFLYVIAPDRRKIPAWALAGVNAAINLTALFSHICFWISDDNHYHGGPLNKFCLYTSVALLCVLMFLTLREFSHIRKGEMFIPLFNIVLILVAIFLDGNVGLDDQPVSFLTEAIVSSCVFFYIWLHLQFVRRHEKELKDGQRVQIMLSQIKPHFLYNSLGAIEELCESDPQMAKAATVAFSRYLRGNMMAIGTASAIPFEKELSHTKFYLELEQIRFEDALQVEYDISCVDFTIPTLTLEPLVENAVRHGIRGNEDGRGTVTISTRELADRFEVSVTDDGPGFDPERMPEDGHPHVGLQNVRERLVQVCGGTLKIESSPAQGTTATIVLPKKRVVSSMIEENKAGMPRDPQGGWSYADPCD